MTPWGFKKNTNYGPFVFYLVSSSDHITPATGLTVAATRSLDGGAFSSTTNAVSEIGGGFYKVNVVAADLNATAEVALRFAAAGADPVWFKIPLQGK